MPKISVIVPVYNSEDFLDECVKSILAQTFSNLELILVDDGSIDKSPEMCDQYAERDPRVRVIHQKNCGVSVARNHGLDTAIGEYITFVDSDDYIEPYMYEKMIFEAEKGVKLVMCDCAKEFSNHTELYTHDIRPGVYDKNQLKREYYSHLLIMENIEYPATISNCLLLFHRSLVQQIRYIQGVRYSEDLLFGAMLAYKTDSFCYLKGKPFYHYRMNLQSATHRFVPDKWEDYKKLHAAIITEFGSCQEFDFNLQIDLCLLFFMYNSIGDIIRTTQLSRKEKNQKIRNDILKDTKVIDMLKRIKINQLKISKKQKLITWLYKKRMAINLLCWYYERK